MAEVSRTSEENRFDLVTGFDVIHDQRDPAAVLANVRRMLRLGGVFLMQDLKAMMGDSEAGRGGESRRPA